MKILLRDRAGVTSVEFALVASLLILLLTGTLSIGLLTWTASMLQSVALQTARCVAIGSSACPSGPTYAVTLAQKTLFTGVINAANVTVSSASSCNGASGSYTKVAISSSYWSGALTPALNSVVNATLCYPTNF